MTENVRWAEVCRSGILTHIFIPKDSHCHRIGESICRNREG